MVTICPKYLAAILLTFGHVPVLHLMMSANVVVMFLQVKCHQYYPCGSVNGGEDVMVFDDVDLRVRFLTVDQMGYYNVSTLEIEDIRVSYEGLILSLARTGISADTMFL